MRFSIITPLYNKGPYVAKAINSVLVQTYTDYELIIIDDGSTDESYEVASRAIYGHDNCHIFHQENAGVSIARNNAVAMSQGEYICFLDADDWWAPTYLEKMDWLIREYPDARLFGTNYYYVKGGRQRVCVTTAKTGYINYCRSYSEKLQMPFWTGATCIPRPIYNEVGGFKIQLKLGEDFDLWINVALKYKVAFLNEPLSYYYQDSDTKWRLVGKLHDPSVHVLWNLDYLEEEEKRNPDFKKLIDNLRIYSLFPYYLSKQHRRAAELELSKIDWKRQPYRSRILYSIPAPLLKCRMALIRCGSRIKQIVIKHL